MKPARESSIAGRSVLLAALLLAIHSIQAAPIEAGPQGGRLVGSPPDQAELLIRPGGLVTVTFLGPDKKPVDPAARSVRLFAQSEAGRREIPLERQGMAFVSKEPLPQPEGYLLMVQTRSGPDAKPVNTRVKYDMHHCGGCQRAEYACTCEGH